MYPFLVLIVLALGLSVLMQTLDELLPFRPPAALARTVGVVIAAGAVWALDYSVFTAFGQDLRAGWMHPVVTGLVLVATGELVRAVIRAIAHRAGEPPVDAEFGPRSVRAA